MNDNSTTLIISIGVIDQASNLYTSFLMVYAAVFMLVYDTMLTFNDEITYIWRSPWSPIKCTFLIVRYTSLGIQIFTIAAGIFPSYFVCSATKWVAGFGGIVLQFFGDIFLVFRAYAFCGRNKRLLVFLIILFVAMEASIFSLDAIFLRRFSDAANPVPQLRSLLGNCIVLNDPRAISTIWIINLIFQSILFLCVLSEAIYTLYGIWNVGIRHAPICAVFMRDGLWAYFLPAVSSLLCVLSAYIAPQFGIASTAWSFTLASIGYCRLILNLHSVVRGDNQTTFSLSLSGGAR